MDDNDDDKEENLQADEGRKSTSTRGKGQKVGTAEHIPSTTTKSRPGRTVKLSAKAQEAKTLAHQNQHSPTEKSSEIEKLVAHLTTLLENLDKGPNLVAITQPREDLSTPEEDEAEDPMRILVTKINSENAVDQDQFANSTQFDVEEPKTYCRAMQGPHAAEWARAMEEELDQLHKNKTWTLVHRDEMEAGHRALGGKIYS